MTDLAPSLAAKISPLIARLASDSEPEVLACVRALRRILESRGLDINDLAAALEPKPVQVVSVQAEPRDPNSWSDLAQWIAYHGRGRLKAHEQAFANDMALRLVMDGEPTRKQAAWLRALYAKLGGEGRA